MRNFGSSKDTCNTYNWQVDLYPECAKTPKNPQEKEPLPSKWAKECPIRLGLWAGWFSSPGSRFQPFCPRSLAQPGGWPWELFNPVALSDISLVCGLWALPFTCPDTLSCSFSHKCLLSHEDVIHKSLPLFLWVVNFWSAILRIFLSGFFLPTPPPQPLFSFPFFVPPCFALKTCGGKSNPEIPERVWGTVLWGPEAKQRLEASHELPRGRFHLRYILLSPPKVGWELVNQGEARWCLGRRVVLGGLCALVIASNFTDKALTDSFDDEQSSNS